MLKNVLNVRLHDMFMDTVLIKGNENGCFTLLREDNVALLYNARGQLIKKCSNALDAIALNNGGYFVKHFPQKDSVLSRSFLKFTPVWSLYNKDDALLLSELSDCVVYPNGWYCVEKDGCKKLFREDHTLVTENFSQCAVFKQGYALRFNETYYKYADWKLFAKDGEHVRNVCSVEAILGDGLLLVRHSPHELAELYGFENAELVAKDISSFQRFANGRFAIKQVSRDGDVVGKMYSSSGHRMTVTVSDAVFLPDGRFVGFHGDRILGLYRSTGLLVSEDIWRYEIAATYYLLTYAEGDSLFNDRSENLGLGYCLVDSDDVFALFENEKAYHLFNQYGQVLTLSIEQ